MTVCCGPGWVVPGTWCLVVVVQDVGVAKLVDKLVTMLVIVRHLCPGHTIPEHVRTYR